MAIKEIELESKEELEAPEALEEAPEAEEAASSIEEALAEFDESDSNEDNSDDTATQAEEVSLESVRAEIDALREENKRLINVVSRLVKNYGAKLGENSATGIEAFRETSVEPKLPSDKLNLSGVPGLDEIVLG